MRDDLRKLRRRTIRRGKSEMSTRFGFHGAEHIRRSTTLILIVPSCLPPRRGRRSRTDIGVQRDGLLIQTYHRLLEMVRLLIGFQNLFHLGEVLLVEFRHAPHFFPATASGRGFPARSGLFPVPHAAPVGASPLPRPLAGRSSGPALPAVCYKPWQ